MSHRHTTKSYENRFILIGLALLMLLAVFPFSASAQMQTTTGINGTVTDASGAVVPGANVEVKEQNTGAVFHDKSNGAGIYNFPSLLPGLYTITVTKAGFETQAITDRRVLATQPATVDVSLTVGRTAQTVTVSAAGAELLTTADQTITGTVTPTLVHGLPVIRGNFFDLLTLAPGVVPQQANGYGGGFGISQASSAFNYINIGNTYNSSGAFVSGNRDSANNVSVDGSNVQSAVYQDAPQLQATDTIQELRVQTANMNAEFGYGAAGISVITKTGTNQFHGDVYEYFRNNVLDANLFFNNQARRVLPHYEQNQFGGSVGGPILKNKLLFFFNFEGLRALQGTAAQATAVPDTYRAGDFSVNANSAPGTTPGQTGYVAPIPIYNPYQYDPVTHLRAQFPGNKIPLGATTLCAPRATCSDSIDLAFLNQWVIHPNAVINNVPTFLGTTINTIHENQFTGRADFLKSEKDTIYGRYSQMPTTMDVIMYEPLAGQPNNFGSYNVVVHWIRSLNPSSVNHFFAGYTRPTWYFGRKLNVPNVSEQIGLKNTGNVPGGPSFQGTGYDMDTSNYSVLTAITNTYQLQDDITWVRGRHTLRAGISLMDKRFSYQGQSYDKGVLNMSGVYTESCPLGDPVCTAAATAAGDALGSLGGHAFADYLLGATSQSGANPNYILQLMGAPYMGYQMYKGFYGQDSWRVTNKLTVNAGLRYENWTPWLLPRNTTVSINMMTGDPLYALANPVDYLSSSACWGSCGKLNPAAVNRSSYKTGNLDFAPRLGLAYQLFPNTVIRASAGIFYDGNVNDNQLSNIQTGAAPFTLRVQGSVIGDEASGPVPFDGETVQTLFPYAGPTSIPHANDNPVDTYRFVLPYMPTGAVDQWSLGVEQRLGKIWGLDLSYVGSHTTHEFQYLDQNSPVLPTPGTPLATQSVQQRRLFPGYGSFGTWEPLGWGRYNGLIASFHNSNAWHGLTLISNFQWDKNIVSSHWGFSDISNLNFRAPYLYMWAGNYTTATPGRVVIGYNYVLPFGRGKDFATNLNWVADRLVSGWTASGISTFAIGSWGDMVDLGPDQSGTSGINMPDHLCDANVGRASRNPPGQNYVVWYNANCFRPSVYGTYGNTNMGVIQFPGINNWDLALSKSTKTGFPRESGELQLRWDMFNAWNHTQWAAPNGYISSWTSITNGRIGGTRPARQMQVTVKYFF